MAMLRCLLLPLYPASLVFVVVAASLLAVTGLVDNEAAVLRVLPAYLLLSMLFKYAYTMLDDMANGRRTAPVPSVESLGPFEMRPLLQLMLCAAVYGVVALVGGAGGVAIAALALALLPASIGVLGVTGSMLDAVNPVALLRAVRGLGWYYAVIVLVAVGYTAALVALSRVPVWEFVLFSASGFAVLSLYSLIGGAFYERRIALGFEPRSSPERRAEVEGEARDRLRNQMLDDVFSATRAGERATGMNSLKQWFEQPDAGHLAADTRAIMTQAVQWNSDRGLQVVTRHLAAELIRLGRADIALDAVAAALQKLPGFALESEPDTLKLAIHARAVGRRRFAMTVLQNFTAQASAPPLSPAAAELLADLQSSHMQ